MSGGNWFNTRKVAWDLRTKNLTTASGTITYTARTGRPADNFITDAFIRVTTTSTYDMTITVPDGVYYGQELWVLFEVEGGTDTVDVSTTTGDDSTQLTAAGDYWHGVWHGGTLGWATINESAT